MEQDLYQKGYEAGLAQGTVVGYRQHHAEMQPLMDEVIECLENADDDTTVLLTHLYKTFGTGIAIT